MTSHFEVIGDVLGDELEGDVLGADPAPVARAGGRLIRLHPRPGWRAGQLAPGVMSPQEGLVPLPLIPDTNNGIFTSAVVNITWVGRLQKPYRAERLLVSAVRAGTSSTARVLGKIFVGVDLQQATTADFDLEQIGVATAFGTRLTLMQAPPGVEITIETRLFPTPPAGTDQIAVAMMFLGRIVH